MILAHTMALDPHNVHETSFRKAAGNGPLRVQLGLGSVATTVRRMDSRPDVAQADRSSSAASTQCTPARRLPLDAGGDEKRAPDGDPPLGPSVAECLGRYRRVSDVSDKGPPRQFYVTQRPIHDQRAERAYSEVRLGADARIATLCRDRAGGHDLPDR
jgi:hypothetical protein